MNAGKEPLNVSLMKSSLCLAKKSSLDINELTVPELFTKRPFSQSRFKIVYVVVLFQLNSFSASLTSYPVVNGSFDQIISANLDSIAPKFILSSVSTSCSQL